MKNTLYLLALSVSLIFTACTSNEQDALPFSPQTEKTSVVNDVNLPYAYLQAFEEVKNIKISYYPEKDGMTLVINTGSQIVNHMYAVIEQQDAPIMVFLGSSEDNKYFIRDINPLSRFNIRIYGSSSDDIQQLVNTHPYSRSTTFGNIPVKGWAASDPYIKVSASRFPSGLMHLYTELQTKEGSILVFLGRPVEEDFEIPKYGSLGVSDLKLFGNAVYRFAETN